MRASCPAFSRASLATARAAPGAGRSTSVRRAGTRLAPDDASASPSSRFLASDPAALVTPSHTLFQQPARLPGQPRRPAAAPVRGRSTARRRQNAVEDEGLRREGAVARRQGKVRRRQRQHDEKDEEHGRPHGVAAAARARRPQVDRASGREDGQLGQQREGRVVPETETDLGRGSVEAERKIARVHGEVEEEVREDRDSQDARRDPPVAGSKAAQGDEADERGQSRPEQGSEEAVAVGHPVEIVGIEGRESRNDPELFDSEQHEDREQDVEQLYGQKQHSQREPRGRLLSGERDSVVADEHCRGANPSSRRPQEPIWYSVRAMRRRGWVALVGAGLLAAGPALAATNKPVLHGRHWMAITGKPLAATAGAMTFQKGGNAVDAACAMLAATTHDVRHALWGGETQALIYDPEDRQGRRASTRSAWRRRERRRSSSGAATWPYPPEYGPLAAVTPGTPGGLMVMLAEYGKLSLADVLAPAIQMAEGYPIEAAARRRDRAGEGADQGVALFREALPDASGRGARGAAAGEIFRQPDLAATLRKLVEAERQAKAAGKTRKDAILAAYERFYTGDIARGVRARLAASRAGSSRSRTSPAGRRASRSRSRRTTRESTSTSSTSGRRVRRCSRR